MGRSAVSSFRPTRPGRRDPYNIHPALLDAAFQVMGGALLSTDSARGDVFLPIGAEAIRWLRPAGRALWVGIKVNAGDDPDVRIVDIALENDEGELVGVIDGLQVRRVNRDSLERALAGGARARTYRRTWREIIAASEPKSSPATYLVVDEHWRRRLWTRRVSDQARCNCARHRFIRTSDVAAGDCGRRPAELGDHLRFGREPP